MAALRIVVSRYAELPASDRDHLEEIAEASFSHIPLVRETEWAVPDWSFRAFDGDELVAFHNIITRRVRIDGRDVDVAGLNNVITLPAHRGKGVASWLLKETRPRWAMESGTSTGLLLCADGLVPFYSRLGWELVTVPVRYSQPDGERRWSASCMLLDDRPELRATRDVDLCGLPW